MDILLDKACKGTDVENMDDGIPNVGSGDPTHDTPSSQDSPSHRDASRQDANLHDPIAACLETY